MLSLYQLFKLIFGIVISSFILFIIVNFVGAYAGIQQDAQQARTLKNFLKTTEDVYISGNAIDFHGLSDVSFDPDTPAILSQTGTTRLSFPLFFSPGDSLFIWQGVLELGWWSFRFAEAMPRTRVIFNTLSPDWSVAQSVVSMLPDSDLFEPKVTFGICDGSVLTENLCAGSLCEKQDFLFYLLNTPPLPAKCTIPMPDDAVLVTISPSCSPPPQGICITPPNPDGIGNLYIGGTPHLYKDSLDIAAAVIGGPEKDLYGFSGETLFTYKNAIVREELLSASEMLAERAFLLGSNHPSTVCRQAFSDIRDSLLPLQQTLADSSYFTSFSTLTTLAGQLSRIRSVHQDMVSKGCDYP